MIIIENVKTLAGKTTTLEIKSREDVRINAAGLTLFPGLIDPHVHFRTPGYEYKEDWETAARACIHGGYTTVFDMPNNYPICVSKQTLLDKKKLIDGVLEKSGIPLRYHLYLGADKTQFDQIALVKNEIIGIKVFMGSSEGNLLMDDESSLHAIFSLAASHNLIISVHAEDQKMIRDRSALCNIKGPKAHSWIRNRNVAIAATKKALSLCKEYRCRLNILHVTTKEEAELIRQAKKDLLPVSAETCPHYLFLNDADYDRLGTRLQVNPSIKTKEDNQALMQAINDGTIDMIGSDHAPHLIEEKDREYGLASSGAPGVETTLPLLLNAYHEKKISLKKIIELTHDNVKKIFSLPHHDDIVLVDLEKEQTVEEEFLQTKCKWSPFKGKKLKGWPIYTILQGTIYHVETDVFAIR